MPIFLVPITIDDSDNDQDPINFIFRVSTAKRAYDDLISVPGLEPTRMGGEQQIRSEPDVQDNRVDQYKQVATPSNPFRVVPRPKAGLLQRLHVRLWQVLEDSYLQLRDQTRVFVRVVAAAHTEAIYWHKRPQILSRINFNSGKVRLTRFLRKLNDVRMLAEIDLGNAHRDSDGWAGVAEWGTDEAS